MFIPLVGKLILLSFATLPFQTTWVGDPTIFSISRQRRFGIPWFRLWPARDEDYCVWKLTFARLLYYVYSTTQNCFVIILSVAHALFEWHRSTEPWKFYVLIFVVTFYFLRPSILIASPDPSQRTESSQGHKSFKQRLQHNHRSHEMK